MSGKVRTATLGACLVAAVLGPATAADAVGEDPAPTRGTIMVCSANNSDVFVDGPSIREDDLASFTKSGECTNWKPVLPGNYEVGYAMRTTSTHPILVECLVRRNKQHIIYKRLNNEGHLYTTVAPGELTRIDLWITQA
jgi:hypothetical protein